MNQHADAWSEREKSDGVRDETGESGIRDAHERRRGFSRFDFGLSRYRDEMTQELAILAGIRDSVHRAYQANANRTHKKEGNPYTVKIMASATADLKAVEANIDKALVRTTKKHPLFPWLKTLKGGPKGAHLARLIGTIGDPLRFPGRICEKGHHVAEDGEDFCARLVGEKGTSRDEMTTCDAPVGPVRRGTGTRSLWHYCGLHVNDDGTWPKKRKGQKCTWNPTARGALLMPDAGIAAQMIRHKCEPYYTEVYLATKERLRLTRGAEASRENDMPDGTEDLETGHGSENEGICGLQVQALGNAEPRIENGLERGVVGDGGDGSDRESERSHVLLRPIQIDTRARIIMVKAFLGDMLQAWKAIESQRRVDE